MGGGVGLAAACDLSLIRSDAQVGFTEVRIGVAPAMISVLCLPKLGRTEAARLMLLGLKASARSVLCGWAGHGAASCGEWALQCPLCARKADRDDEDLGCSDGCQQRVATTQYTQ